MKRTGKRWKLGVLAAALLGICTGAGAQDTEEVLLCGENETFCISYLDGGEIASYVNEYDCHGTYLGSRWEYVTGMPPEHGFLVREDLTYDTEEAEEAGRALLRENGYDTEDTYGVRYRGLPGLGWSAASRAVYVLTDTGCAIGWGDEILEVPFEQEDLRLDIFNEEVTIARRYGFDGMDEFWIIENGTGSVLHYGEGESFMNFRLGDGFCTYMESKINDEGYNEWNTHLIDYSGNELFETRSDLCMAWENGLVYIERGPYRGLADLNGEWVFKVMEGER